MIHADVNIIMTFILINSLLRTNKRLYGKLLVLVKSLAAYKFCRPTARDFL